MLSSKEELLSAVDKIQGLPVLVVGDVILDRYVWGSVERISPEAPVPVVDVKRIEDRLGGAANVVRNLVGLGARASLSGFIGADDDGRIILSHLDALGVDHQGVIIDRDRPTSLKTRVIAHGQQVVRIDREVKSQPGTALCEGLAAVVDSQIDSSKAVIVSDYAKGTLSEPLMKRIHAAHEPNGGKPPRIALATRPLLLDPHPANYGLYRRICIVKANRKETEKASSITIDSPKAAQMAAQVLFSRWKAEMVMVTLSEDGMVLLEAGKTDPLFLETRAREVFDVSGAGDTVGAIFVAALAAGATPTVAGELANIGAGIVIAEVGTVSIEADRLRDEIRELAS